MQGSISFIYRLAHNSVVYKLYTNTPWYSLGVLHNITQQYIIHEGSPISATPAQSVIDACNPYYKYPKLGTKLSLKNASKQYGGL